MYKSVLKRYISCKEIVYSSVKSITYETFTNMYIIKIDDNALLPMTRVKIIDLVKLINYGNLWINGLPIYSKIFNGV